MAKYRIVWDDIISDDDLSLERGLLSKEEMDQFELIRLSSKDPAWFLDQAKDADGICAYLPIREEDFQKLSKCRVVAVPALGVDPFDLSGATKAGIYLCNAPTYCIEEVATHTIALALDCVRRISRQDRLLRQGVWNWSERGIQRRLSELTWGFVSFGAIAQKVSQMIAGFGMERIAFDPFLPIERFVIGQAEQVDTLEALLQRSDIVSVHTPYSLQTHHMLDERMLSLIKPGALLVVTGRGGVVDEVALRKAIESGRIPAVGLDVIEDEVGFQSVLRGLPQVTITPHCAYYSEESTRELRTTNMQQIMDVLKYNKEPAFLVNKDVRQRLKNNR
jgi:D-3-phosphoglycerate dehydrogenase